MTYLQTINLILFLILFVFFLLFFYFNFYWAKFWQNYKTEFNRKKLINQSLFPFSKKIRHLKKNRSLFIFVSFILSLFISYLLFFPFLRSLAFIPKNYPELIYLPFLISLFCLLLISQLNNLVASFLISQLEQEFYKFIYSLKLNVFYFQSIIIINLKITRIFKINSFLDKTNHFN